MKLLLLAASLALGSEPAPSTSTVHNPGAYLHLTTRQWLTLDPSSSFDAVSFIATANIYEPLLAMGAAGDPTALAPFLSAAVPTRENGLASEDGLVYAFPIRKGVKFHDGKELTPDDVRYSLLRFMLSDVDGGPAALLLKPVLGRTSTRDKDGQVTLDFKEAASAVRVDGDKVVVRLKAPFPAFLKVVASLPIVVSRAWAKEHGEWDGEEASWKAFNGRDVDESYFHSAANGTGPFALEKEDRTFGALTLKRHDAYWGGRASLEAVQLRVVPNKAVRLGMLEAGDADAAYFESRDVMDVQDMPGVVVHEEKSPSSIGEVVFFAPGVDPESPFLGSGKLDGKGVPPELMKDADFRAGVAQALDYEGYLQRGLGGRGRRVSSPIPQMWLKDGPAAPKTDLKQAEKALKKALGGKLWKTGMTLTVGFSPSNAARWCLANGIKESLEKLNPKFKVNLVALPSDEFYGSAEGLLLPMFITGYYADYPDANAFAFGLMHSGGYYPKAQGWSSAEADRLVDAAGRESDPAKRTPLYGALAALAAKEKAQLYTYAPDGITAARSWMSGFETERNVANLRFNGFPYFYALKKAP